MKPSFLRRTALTAALAAALPLAAFAQHISVEKIGPVQVTGISADGNAATGITTYGFRVFRWTPETGVVRLPRTGYSGVPEISDDGKTIAATILSDDGTRATQGRWTESGGWVQTTLPPDGGQLDSDDSTVFGLSRDGSTVTGLYWRPGQTGGLAHGSSWKPGSTLVGLPTRGGSSRVDDANQDGSVLVGWEENPTSGERQPAVWENGVRTMLPPEGGTGEATAVNGAGNVVVGISWDDTIQHSVATIWRKNGGTWTRTLLGILKGTTSTGYSGALDVSEDGNLVVGYNRDKSRFFDSRGFIWTPERGMVLANKFVHSRGKDILGKFDIWQVTAVNGDGTAMAAFGVDARPPFQRRSILIRLVPETPPTR